MAAVISNQDYAAGGPFAYVREGGTAAWSRHRPSLGRARMSGRKMYPNNTMRAELESRLRCLKEKGSSNRFMRKKAEDLEEMLATVDRSELEKRLLHLKKVSIAVPSSIVIKRKIAEAEKVLGVATDAGDAATTKTEDVEAADFPAPDEDVEAAALLAPARALEAHQVDAGDDGAVRACNSPKPIFQKFNENILEDRKKLLNLVKSTLKKKDVIPKKADKILATDGDTKAQESLSKEFTKPSGLKKKFSIMTAPATTATVQLLQMMLIIMLLLKVGHIEYRERHHFGCVDAINKVDLNGIALAEIKEDIMTFLNGQVPRVPCCDCGAIINRVQHNRPSSDKSNEDNVALLNGRIRHNLESVSSVPADADVENEDEMQVDKVSVPPIQFNAEADPGKVSNLRAQHIAEAFLFIIIIVTRGYFSTSSVKTQGELLAVIDDAVKKDHDPGKVSVKYKLKQKKDDDNVNKNANDEKKETDNYEGKNEDDNEDQEENEEDNENEIKEKKEDILDEKVEGKEIPNRNSIRKFKERKEFRMQGNEVKLFRKFVIEI